MEAYKISEDCKILRREEKAILCNGFNGKYQKVSNECLDILNKGIEYGLSVDDLLDALADDEDRAYMKRLIEILRKKEILIDKSKDVSKKTIDSIHINITHRCNLQCIHCGFNAKAMVEKEVLSTDEWKKLLIKAIGCCPNEITISGGEPLVREDFNEIMDFIKSRYDGTLSLMTNGTLINGENVDKLTEYFDTFSISLDGVDEESCSKIRGKGVFDKVINAVKLLQSKGIDKISLSMVETKTNKHLLKKFIDLNKELGTQDLIRALEITGKASDNRESLEIKRLYLEDDNGNEENYIKNPIKCYNCQAAKNTFLINYDARLYPCPALDKDSFCLGNLKEIEDLKEYIYNLNKNTCQGYKYFESMHPHSFEYCNNCDVNMFCWYCSIAVLHIKDDKDKFDAFCRINKKQLNMIWSD